MRLRAVAISNDPVAEEAAQAHLAAQGGSAVGAVLSGFFAAAGAYSGVLLSPLTVLVGGIGTGGRAFDGRVRQAGLGTKRPRGFLPEEQIPEAARVGVPMSVAAAAVAYAYDGGKSLGSVVKAGMGAATRAGADARASVLRRIRAVGPHAITEAAFTRPLLHVAGPSEGGLLTPTDFAQSEQLDHPAAERRADGVRVLEAPWAGEPGETGSLSTLGIGCAVCAVDVRGVFAAVSYFRVSDGVSIDELMLEAPLIAIPTQRGVTRVAPGKPLPAPAPLAILVDESGAPVSIEAEPAASRFEPGMPHATRLRIERNTATREVVASRV